MSLSKIARGSGFNTDPLVQLIANEAATSRAHNEISELESERGDIIEKLRAGVKFTHISPGAGKISLHQQLMANERVHPVDSVDELLDKRIGDLGDNKRCFARVFNNAGNPLVTAGIFTAMVTIPNSGAALDHSQIPGYVNAIKDMDIEPFATPEADETAVAVLYTISSSDAPELKWDKGGRPLAQAVYQHLHQEAKDKGYNLLISTLSPVRNFSTWLAGQDGFTGYFDDKGKPTQEFHQLLTSEETQEVVKSALMDYLAGERDPVLNFHLGNGAYIGDVKFNPDNEADWAMVNYVYPSDTGLLAYNKELYAQTKIKPVAVELQGYVSADLRNQTTYVLPQDRDAARSELSYGL
jgi:hypothetical protein